MCLGKEKVGHPRQESGADKLSRADEGEDRAGQALHPSAHVWQAKCTRWGGSREHGPCPHRAHCLVGDPQQASERTRELQDIRRASTINNKGACES